MLALVIATRPASTAMPGIRSRSTAPRDAPRAPAAGAVSAGHARDHEALALQALFQRATYVSSGRDWHDYAPAYRYGAAARRDAPSRRFEDAEGRLAADWPAHRGESRLHWAEARAAVRDAWNLATSRHAH